MSSYISSLPFRIQHITQVYRGGCGFRHRHGKKNNNMQNAFTIDEKETDFKSEMAAKINVNLDADAKQQNKQEEKYPKGQTEDKIEGKKPFGLDSLEFVSKLNKMSL